MFNIIYIVKEEVQGDEEGLRKFMEVGQIKRFT